MAKKPKKIRCICGFCLPGPPGSLCGGEEILKKHKTTSILDRFEAVKSDFGKFDKVENKLSQRMDIHALVILDKLFPGNENIIYNSTDNRVYLDIENKLLETLTDDNILELVRCEIQCNYRGLFIVT
jgi:hypothetical protein